MVATSPAAPTGTASVMRRIDDLAQTLQNHGANDGAKRLKMVAKQIQHFTVEGAFQYLRRDEIVEELENQSHTIFHFTLRIMRACRNILSIAPIVLTWLALGLAATAYQNDLADTTHYPNDLYQPFLDLWQIGFHGNHGPVISFSTAAGWDAFFLTLLVILVAVIPILEWQHRKGLYTFLEDFDAVIDELLDQISKDGANSHLADSDVNKITKGIEGALQKVMLNYKQVAVEASDLVKDTHQQTRDLIQNFNTDLKIFNSDVTALTGGLHKLDNNLDSYGQKLTELTDASSKLAGSSNDLALNAKSMADSATQNSLASQGISTQLSTLNTAQQAIVNAQKQVVDTITQTQGDVVKQFATTQQDVVKEIGSTQTTVVKDISGVADKMEISAQNTRDVAKEMDRVAQKLEQLTRADLQTMTDRIGQAATQVDRIYTSMGNIDTQLQNTTQALHNASKALSATAAGKPQSSLVGNIISISVRVGFALGAIAVIGELFVLILRSH